MQLAKNLRDKRVSCFNKQKIQQNTKNPLDAAYQLFLKKPGISADDAPIVDKQKNKLIIH